MSKPTQPVRSRSLDRQPQLRAGLMAAALMLALSIPLLYLALTLVPVLDPRLDVILIPGSLLLGTAAGGLAALRLVTVAWRTLVWAALGAALLTVFYVALQIPQLSPVGVGEYPGAWWDVLKNTAVLVVTAAAGVLVLPLVDPVLRRAGPAPNVLHVLAAAGLLTGGTLLVERLALGTGGPFFGLTTLIVAGLLSAVVLAGLGLLLSLVKREELGAWLGALAVLLWALGTTAWWLAGHPWFP